MHSLILSNFVKFLWASEWIMQHALYSSEFFPSGSFSTDTADLIFFTLQSRWKWPSLPQKKHLGLSLIFSFFSHRQSWILCPGYLQFVHTNFSVFESSGAFLNSRYNCFPWAFRYWSDYLANSFRSLGALSIKWTPRSFGRASITCSLMIKSLRPS